VGYSTGLAVIKYREGFTNIPTVGIIPTPWQLWHPSHQKAIFPLYLTFSVAWSLEIVTHLEELCFWLFLINAGSTQQDWFSSIYFKSWAVGSSCAVIYMPVVTTFTRRDPYRCEAFTFLAGCLGSLLLTLSFVSVLWTFPSFLKNLRKEGVDSGTVVRLTKFHELNTIRVLFRCLFIIPFLILAVDGIYPHPHLNRIMAVTDAMVILAAVGLVVSSSITLVIFFPRSIEGEIEARDASREKRLFFRRRTLTKKQRWPHTIDGTYSYTISPIKTSFSIASPDGYEFPSTPSPSKPRWKQTQMENDRYTQMPGVNYAGQYVPARSNRREEERTQALINALGLTEFDGSTLDMGSSRVNPILNHYISPIDVAYASAHDPSCKSAEGMA